MCVCVSKESFLLSTCVRAKIWLKSSSYIHTLTSFLAIISHNVCITTSTSSFYPLSSISLILRDLSDEVLNGLLSSLCCVRPVDSIRYHRLPKQSSDTAKMWPMNTIILLLLGFSRVRVLFFGLFRVRGSHESSPATHCIFS